MGTPVLPDQGLGLCQHDLLFTQLISSAAALFAFCGPALGFQHGGLVCMCKVPVTGTLGFWGHPVSPPPL